MKTGIIVQARMGSSRFPGKVLKKINGKTVLEHLMDRLRISANIDAVIVALTDSPKDDILYDTCLEHNYPCYRGDEDNVLRRYYECAVEFKLDTVIRVCSDAPLTDLSAIEQMINIYKFNDTQLVHNRFKEGWPPGGAADVFSMEALHEANKSATENREKEHVIPYMVKHGKRFGEIKLAAYPEILRPYYNLTIDYPDDLQKFEKLLHKAGKNSLAEIEFRKAIKIIDGNNKLQELFGKHLHY